MDLNSKRQKIHFKAEKYKNNLLLGDYKSIEKAAIKSYLKNNDLPKIFSDFDISVLPKPQKQMAKSLFSSYEFIPILIDMMLNHKGVIAYSVYKTLYRNDYPELIIEHDNIYKNEDLMNDFLNKGANRAALSEMNAELWLNSEIGESFIFERYYDD